jgi:hypothetical protein
MSMQALRDAFKKGIFNSGIQPAYSPDLDNHDYGRRDCLKDQVYSSNSQTKELNVVTSLVGHQNYRMVVPKELEKGRYFHSNESIITFQGVTMNDSFAVHMKTLELTRWSCMVFRELPMLRKSC